MDVNNVWVAIVGIGFISLLSLIVDSQQLIQLVLSFFRNIKSWWTKSLPAQRVLGSLANNNVRLTIFIRDFFIANGTSLYTQEGLNGMVGVVPNVTELWPNVEGKSLARILNLLGIAGRTKNIEIVEMGKDPGLWESNIIILGAQTQKCFDFYSKMNEVAFSMDALHIYNTKNGKPIKREQGYGYGIILKCKNPYFKGGKGIGFLLGGYGTLGTEAAMYYFTNNIDELGKTFGKKSFGVVVRASISAGIQSTQRLSKYDRTFK